jgi:hypothetical protein
LISNWPLLNTAGMDGRYKEELIAAAKRE